MRALVAAGSILITWLLFHQYLPPAKSVHFWADIDGYHYPLLTYAHNAIREGRLPEWEHSTYSGMPFAGNIQAGLFYPPNWLLFAVNRRPHGLRVKTLEWLEVAHYWLAFLLAYLWLRRRWGGDLPAALGGAVFALGGYPLAESQHLGVICGYAWMPLAMWGLDEFAESRNWRVLWKTAAASALALLAGYPAHWLAVVAAIAAYGAAMAGWRGLAGASGAVGFSGLLAAVQLGATAATLGLKDAELTYFPVLERDPWFYLHLAVPNFYEHSIAVLSAATQNEQYGYLGSPALFAILWLAFRRQWRTVLPALALLAVALLFLLNPAGIVGAVVRQVPVLPNVLRAWTFLGILPLAAALLTSRAADVMLGRPGEPLRRWAALAVPVLLLVWAARQLVFRARDFWLGTEWLSAAEAAICVLLFGLGIVAARNGSRLAAMALLAAVLSEYYVYGIGRRFNAKPGYPDIDFHKDMRAGGEEMLGVDNAVFAEMRRHPAYRVAIVNGSHPTDMRHYGLATPQGFDPMLTRQYKKAVERYTSFESNRIFQPPVENEDFLREFGVRFVYGMVGTEAIDRLGRDPRFRRMDPPGTFFEVFEYRNAQPAYRFPAGRAEVAEWTPERRRFRVESSQGGQFVLAEQFFPGWRATLDGESAAIARVQDTWQGVQVPAGSHTLTFEYRSMGMRYGAVVTLGSLFILLAIARASAASRERTR